MEIVNLSLEFLHSTKKMPFLQIEVVFADNRQQKLIQILVPTNTNISAAVKLSGILLDFPDVDLSKNKVGIFGKLCSLNTEVKDGDRIEIYQPIVIDPKKIRLNRAKKQKSL
jgi:uncharacterized protein